MVTTVERGIDKLCNGLPRRTAHTVADFRIGNAKFVELGADAFESLVQSGEINMLAIGARVDDGGFNSDEAMTVRAGLARSQTDIPKIGCFGDDGVYDEITFAAASPLLQVTFDHFHRRHDGMIR